MQIFTKPTFSPRDAGYYAIEGVKLFNATTYFPLERLQKCTRRKSSYFLLLVFFQHSLEKNAFYLKLAGNMKGTSQELITTLH